MHVAPVVGPRRSLLDALSQVAAALVPRVVSSPRFVLPKRRVRVAVDRVADFRAGDGGAEVVLRGEIDLDSLAAHVALLPGRQINGVLRLAILGDLEVGLVGLTSDG